MIKGEADEIKACKLEKKNQYTLFMFKLRRCKVDIKRLTVMSRYSKKTADQLRKCKLKKKIQVDMRKIAR